jgi:hypothetical protein
MGTLDWGNPKNDLDNNKYLSLNIKQKIKLLILFQLLHLLASSAISISHCRGLGSASWLVQLLSLWWGRLQVWDFGGKVQTLSYLTWIIAGKVFLLPSFLPPSLPPSLPSFLSFFFLPSLPLSPSFPFFLLPFFPPFLSSSFPSSFLPFFLPSFPPFLYPSLPSFFLLFF